MIWLRFWSPIQKCKNPFLSIYTLLTLIWEAPVLWLTLWLKHNIAEYQSLLFLIQHCSIAICWDHASLVIFVVVILYTSCDCLVLPPDILLGTFPHCALSTSHSFHSIVTNLSWSLSVHPLQNISPQSFNPTCHQSMVAAHIAYSLESCLARVNDTSPLHNMAPAYPQHVYNSSLSSVHSLPSIAYRTTSLRQFSCPFLQYFSDSCHQRSDVSPFTLCPSQHLLCCASPANQSTISLFANESLPQACLLPKEDKELAVFKFLQEHEGMYILHTIVDGGASHKLCACDAWTTFHTSYHSFHSQIQFIVKGVCYCCSVPMFQCFNHPFCSKNNNPPSRFNDILKPLSWVLYSILSLRAVIMDHVGVGLERFCSFWDYVGWLGEDWHGNESLINMWEMCHAYAYLLNNNRSVGSSTIFHY